MAQHIEKELGWEEARQEIIQELEMIAKSTLIPSASFSGVLDTSLRLYMIKKRVVVCPLLSWLQRQTFYPRVFWGSRHKDWMCAGIGSAFFEHAKDQDKPDIFWERVNAILAAEADVKLFFGMSFSKTLPKTEWKDFYAMQALLPRFCVIQEKGAYYFLYHVVTGDGERIPFDHLRRELDSIVFSEGNDAPLPSVVARRNLPYYDEWSKKVALVEQAIENGLIEKIALSRRVTLELSEYAEPCILLDAVARRCESGVPFLFQNSIERYFLGVSQTLLYARHGRNIKSEVVLGTCLRGESVVEDELLGRALFTSVKDRKEQRYLVAALLDQMREICLSYDPPSDGKVVRSAHQQSVVSILSGKLQPEIKERDILTIFHPDLLMGGVPREQSLSLIDQWEEFERGWFASPVGLISRENVEIMLATTCCLGEEKEVHLFSTANLPEGMSPWNGWEEMEIKIRVFLDVFMTNNPRR